MVSEGRIYKIVPRKGTKTLNNFPLKMIYFAFIKLFPVRGRREPEGSIFLSKITTPKRKIIPK